MASGNTGVEPAGDLCTPRAGNMNTVIYWFSGTGNSLALAKALADELSAETRPMATASTSTDASCVGFVFPVHAFGVPTLVRRFARCFTASRAEYVFAVATYGRHRGHPGRMLAADLAGSGLTLAASWSVRMAQNYVAVFSPPGEAKQARLLEAAGKRLRAIAAGVRERECGVREDAPLLAWPLLAPVGALFRARSRQADRFFSVSDACTRCGQCARICPTGNIAVGDTGPTWNHRCVQCFACIHWCPVAAIQYGPLTSRRRRYHHPDIRVADLIEAHAAKAD